MLGLAVAMLGIAGWAGLDVVRAGPVSAEQPAAPGPIAPQQAPAREVEPEALATTPASLAAEVPRSGALVVSASLGGRSQILALGAGDPYLRQLTAGDWDHRDPAVSPTMDRLAFASHRDGNWELYVLDLPTGEQRRLTDTPGYEGNPTWSPDGLWLAYEAHYGNDFNIWVLPVDGGQPPVQLTDYPGIDLSPAWDPAGRRIAFVSDRDGSPDIFLADLDKPVDRFTNLTRTSALLEADPAFSPDGTQLAYSIQVDGVPGIQVVGLGQSESVPRWIGQGQDPVWIADGSALSAVLRTPTTSHIVTYPILGAAPLFGALVEGNIGELHWASVPIGGQALSAETQAQLPFEVVWDVPRQEGERLASVPLTAVQPPGLTLSDAADEAFDALRARVALDAGWDVLSRLEYAFVGVNEPLPPGFAYNDWLYTGRAFALSRSAFQAGWAVVVREDFGLQTYWRVFVRAAAQDGSQGAPLRRHPWDFESRYGGDPAVYDQGGQETIEIPAGYYIDFTALAAAYGFERQPALSNWRSFYPGARYDEFAFRRSLDWLTAMRELYPDAAIATPTPYQTPTPTATNTPRPTPTPWWWRWRTPTPVPSATPTVQP